MVANFGYGALVISLLVSLFGIVASFYGVRKGGANWVESARLSMLLTFPLITVSALSMVYLLATGHYEVAKYYSISQHLIIPETLCINEAVWNTLSADDQKILREAAQESALLQRKLWKERSMASEQKVKSGGSAINAIPDKSAFQAAMKPVYAKFLADNPNLKELVELIQNTP